MKEGLQHKPPFYPDAEEKALLYKAPIRITVAGHTNRGKTAWLYSFLGMTIQELEEHMAEAHGVDGILIIDGKADTTIDIFPEPYSLTGKKTDPSYIEFYDVPGQNWSGRLLAEARERYGNYPNRANLLEMIKDVRSSGDSGLQTDLKLLKHFSECDAILLVVDCRKRVSEDILDEHELVKRLGVELIVVLNYSSTIEGECKHLDEWRERFRIEGTRVSVKYDAFMRHHDSDKVLHGALCQALTRRAPDSDLWIQAIDNFFDTEILPQRNSPLEKASRLFAEFLIGLTGYQKKIKASAKDVDDVCRTEIDKLSKIVRNQEAHWVEAAGRCFSIEKKLLKPYLPKPGETRARSLSPERIKTFGSVIGSGALIGGTVGLGVDMLLLGGTFGGPTMAGSAVGGWIGYKVKNRVYEMLTRKARKVFVPDHDITLIAANGVELLTMLYLAGRIRDRVLPEPSGRISDKNVQDIVSSLRAHRSVPQMFRQMQNALNTGKPQDGNLKQITNTIIQAVKESATLIDRETGVTVVSEKIRSAGGIIKKLRKS